MPRARLFLASFVAIAVGCSNDPGSSGDPDSGVGPGEDGGGGPGLDGGGPPPGDAGPLQEYTLTFGPVTGVAPGTETTQCVIMRLGNAAQLRVGAIHNVLSSGSHHFIVYRTSATEEQRTPFDCQPFADTLNPAAGSPLMITQRADELLELPSGVAFTLEPNQMIRLEMHYINYTPDPIDIQATATFIPIPDAEFQYEADFLFIGNPDIDIPARSTATLGPTYFPLPAEFADANFFGITGHTHQYGTNVRVWSTPSETGADTPVYDVSAWSWSEPETVRHDPAFQVPAGGGFRFTCEWNNTSDAAVGFGESANDEMCFFWAYYYPSHGAFVCAHTDQITGGFDLCCPGNPLCGAVL